LATRRDPSPRGIFINDLHEPFVHVLEGLTQTHPDTKPVPGGSDLGAKPALGDSDPSTSMTASPANIAVLALNQTDWRASLLAYLL